MSQQPTYGPHNPHPLSQMRTELIWEGKYDEYGNRREVDIAGCAMPMQMIESIDEPRRAAAATGQLELFEQQNPRVDDFRNRLIWGDNKLVMASLLQEFKGKVDLIYIDPPFDVGADFSMQVQIGQEGELIGKDQSTLEMVAYRDMWGKGKDSYLQTMYERLTLAKDLLGPNGSIFVHCDYRVNGHLRLILDDIFGYENLNNEIIWGYRTGGIPEGGSFSKKHDTLYWFRRGENCTYNPQKEKVRQHRKYGHKTIQEFQDEYGFYRFASMRDVWDDLNALVGKTDGKNEANTERVGYPTQKPEALLERIIQASSNEGDLVADFFCGSGTTGAVAERLGRRWIMCDLGRFAIHTSRKRMIELQRKLHSEGKPYRAFDVYNLGRYERQWWQKDRLQGADEEHRRVILEFFKAEVLTNPPSPLLHGRKAGAFCHVDGIDSLFTREEAKQVA